MPTSVVIVLTSVPSSTAGEEIARTLVLEKLAACVNIGAAMTSIYRWRGHLARETEHQLAIKTTADRLAAVQERVTQLHPYELPEFLVCEAAASSPAYLAWVRAETLSDSF
jgi:periplasmic divalent cation tolerance protein